MKTKQNVWSLSFILALVLFFISIPAFAQRTIQIKMSSPVPENTPWGKLLNNIASDWHRITNGQVSIIIYHNGTAGKEEAVVRNMRLNQLQGAALSTFGLTEVTPDAMTFSCPFFIRDDEELDLVLSSIKDELEDKIRAAGLHTIAWTRVGWVKFFSKTPIITPDDLKKQKLGSLNEYEKLNQAFRTMGFQMVPIAQSEMVIALSSPMVDAVYNNPATIGSAQAFGAARNMTSINVAPFMGAIVINQRTWNSIPDRFKPAMMEAVERRRIELDAAVKVFEEDMIRLMKNYGLTVHELTPAQEKLWYDEFARVEPTLVGSVFERGLYNRIKTILDKHRSGQ